LFLSARAAYLLRNVAAAVHLILASAQFWLRGIEILHAKAARGAKGCSEEEDGIVGPPCAENSLNLSHRNRFANFA
jgi:hypothetical protein